MPLNSIFSFKINFMKIKTLVLFTMVSFFLGAQTVGNIPKYATGTTFNNSVIFQNGTNIGIGTTTPTGRLMINNQPSAVAAPGLYISYTPFAPGNSGTANDYFKIQQESYTFFNSTQPANTYLTVKNTGYVGIGTPTPTAVLDVKNITGLVPTYRLTSSAGNVSLQVNDDGNIGIGTNNPLEKLDVMGNLKLNNNTIYLRGNWDYNHGLRWCGYTAPFAAVTNIDGPVLFGWNGGVLGTTQSGVQTAVLKWNSTGQVTIGDVNTPAGYSLYVDRGILTEKVKVAIKTTGEWSDFVFDKKYKLKPLEEVENYIKSYKHLPEVPSAEDVVCEGVDMAKMDAILLQKIEELTLYIIQLKKENQDIREQLDNFNK